MVLSGFSNALFLSLQHLCDQIKEEMAFHNINLYPYQSEEDDEQDAALNESIQDLIPFAVVGSEKTIIVDGKSVRGRQNRWGVINGTRVDHVSVFSVFRSCNSWRLITLGLSIY